ncbi:MAG: hypothetical protein H6Q19_1594 [Bacteroidetes bacterium]|nr:hypothetical protein [Bacteroidota bacterium]
MSFLNFEFINNPEANIYNYFDIGYISVYFVCVFYNIRINAKNNSVLTCRSY